MDCSVFSIDLLPGHRGAGGQASIIEFKDKVTRRVQVHGDIVAKGDLSRVCPGCYVIGASKNTPGGLS